MIIYTIIIITDKTSHYYNSRPIVRSDRCVNWPTVGYV